MTPTQRDAMEQALEWIEDAVVVLSHTSTAIQGGIGAEAEGVGGCSVKVVDALRTALADSERDWALLEATQESLREHMAEVQRLRKALEFTAQHKRSDWPERCQQMVDTARAALAEPQGEPVRSDADASSFIESRLWEAIDMHGMFPRAAIDPRTWKHLSVYAPQQPQQEPVAYAYQWKNGKDRSWTVTVARWPESDAWHEYPLYTAPQPAKQPLTREQAMKIVEATPDTMTAVRMTEAAHGITGEKT